MNISISKKVDYSVSTKNSKGRIFKEAETRLRSPFQRDRDRIIHSAAFRRLQHKTQVFITTEGDHFRTRLTHSMEVSQISRTIARALNLNEDLCETLSLAHDMGHTPFGHAGEVILNECMKKFGGFDHNIQTLRIVTVLEEKYYHNKGLNLTIETLDGLIKHNGPVYNRHQFNRILKLNTFKNKINFSRSPHLESQVSSISDDIAYNNHDIQDGLKAKMFKLKDLMEINFFKDISNNYKKKYKNLDKDILIYQIIRDSINLMVKDLIANTMKNLKIKKIKSISDIYLCKDQIVCFSDKFTNIEKEIKFFLRTKMYNNKKVLVKNIQGKKIINKLFDVINRNPKKYLNNRQLKLNKQRAVADFISGMTDRYAINLYNKIK